MAENDVLKAYIANCGSNLTSTTPLLYEASFFKIYVKFEVFLSEMFKSYCVGTINSKGYCPQRKLAFVDVEQLDAVLKGDKQYVDYLKKIESLSKHIFIDNPFNVIFDVADNATYINQMMALRNYIAHESSESRNKYVQTCLSNKTFVEPRDFLMMKNKKNSKSYYTIYINKILQISDLILEKPIV